MKIKFTLLCFAVALFASKPITLKAQVNVQDSLALVDLYNSTNGPGWYNHTNWLTGNPVSQWYGITVADSRVTKIFLAINNLINSIPPSLGNLVNLSVLILDGNKLNGSIPSEIGNLTNLRDLYLDDNQLSGSIPSSLGNLVNLDTLWLSYNQLSGSIPSSLGNLVNLNGLLLYNNQLSGGIPSELGNLINLADFTVDHNQLSGSIPASLGNLINLIYLSLNNNQLSGSIPSTLGNLVNLYNLYLNDNQLSGSIPTEIGNLVRLTFLYLHNNQLNGSIPSNFGNLKNLYDLRLSNNELKGQITFTIGNLRNLHYLYVDHNRLSGNISSALANRPLNSLDLSHNRFTFNGMELIAQTFPFAKYYNQARIPVHLNGNALSVSAGGTLSNNTYRWYKFGETNYTEIAADSVFHPTQSGTYYANIANSVATKLLLKSDTITYTATAALNNSITSSVNDLQISSKTNLFLVYPNPAKDILHVQSNGSASYSLVNDAGKILLTTNINGNSSMNISGIAAGLYYLKSNKNGIVEKVIISR